VSALQRFENKLEELISSAFARTFRSAVQPVEISSALNREIDNGAQILSRDRRLVPNDFHVELSPADHQRLAELGDSLPGELANMLRDHAASQSYVFTGPVSVRLESAEDLTTGRFRVRSKSVSSVSSAGGAATETAVRRASASLVVNGDSLPLSTPGIIVGRGNDADLRVDDPGVSRKHLEIRVTDSPNGPRLSAHDLGSTNGVLVNGSRIESQALRDGDTVRIGHTEMTVRVKQA
jgi:hypothetical protein